MIDFSYLGEAMLLSAGESASFNDLYKGNRRANLANSLDSSPIALAVIEMARTQTKTWEGTLKALKELLDSKYHQAGVGWAKSPKGLSDILRRIKPALREVGVMVKFTIHMRDGNHLTISYDKSFFRLENNVQQVHMFTDQPKNECVNIVNVKDESIKKHKKEYISQLAGKNGSVSAPPLEINNEY